MKSKSIVKQLAAVAVALVLLIVAVVVSRPDRGIEAGAGNGSDAEITSLSDMRDLISSMAAQLSESDMGNLAASLAADPEAPKYESVTLHETSAVSMYKSEVTQSSKHTQDLSMQREMGIYITPDAAYYDVFARIYMNTFSQQYGDSGNRDSTTNKVFNSLRVKIYISQERVLWKFDEFTVVQNGVVLSGLERILGKWIDLTELGDGSAEELIPEHATNLKILALMGEYAGMEEGFKKSSGEYRMTDELFKSFEESLLELFGSTSVSLDDVLDGEFIINCFTPTAPTITLGFEANYSQAYTQAEQFGISYEQPGITLNDSEEDIFRFSNINNTVISLPENLDAMSAEEFVAIMEEVEKGWK